MERSLKKDVIRELITSNGRILLHDEVEERPGVFSIIPIWEDVGQGGPYYSRSCRFYPDIRRNSRHYDPT